MRHSIAPLVGVGLPLLVIAALAGASSAAVLRVEADGSGAFATIQDAIDAACWPCMPADVIELGDGIYSGDGNWNLGFADKTITFRSASGNPSSCKISLAGRALGANPGSSDVSFIGIGFENGAGISGGAGGPAFTNCVFENIGLLSNALLGGASCTDCVIAGGSGGFIECGEGPAALIRCAFTGRDGPIVHASDITVTGCSFRNCTSSAYLIKGLAYLFPGSVAVTGCIFENNSVVASIIEDDGECTLTATDCTFWRNSCFSVIGMSADNSNGNVQRCTFGHNGSGGADIWMSPSGALFIDSSILAYREYGPAVDCGLGTPSVTATCTDIYGNGGGDWIGCLAGQEEGSANLHVPPRFCEELGAEPYRLQVDSPCAHAGVCGLIGAQPAECSGPVRIAPTSWGRIKNTYR